MKKIVLSALAFSLISSMAIAQGKGGFPWSYQYNQRGISVNTAVKAFPALNMSLIEEEDNADAASAIAKPTRIAFPVDANINMFNSGSFTYLDNGDIVWSAKISVPGAIVLDATFDAFQLPKGVQLYFYNENKRQVDGSYDQSNQNEFNTFRSDYIQGETINIELNIPAGTNLNDIQFNINKIGAYYRGGIPQQIASTFADEGTVETEATQADDVCHKNANCDGYGTTYYAIKQTAAHIDMGGYVCSGNLINNTADDCKPLFLTASHCESSGSFRSATFSNWKFYFNYESDGCSGGTARVSDFVTGAYFKARSIYPAATNPNDKSMKADHLLLELKASKVILAEYDAYLGGWDRSANLPTAVDEKLWINFSHPGGVRKKVALTKELTGDGTFNQSAIPETHWRVGNFSVGGTQGGSSGSAIFHAPSARIIGDLSGGPEASGSGSCPNIKTCCALYAKLSRSWSNNGGEGGATDSTSLRKYLDPNGTNATTTNTVKITATGCEASGTSVDEIRTLENNIMLYPNPTSNTVNVKINTKVSGNYSMTITDLLGKIVVSRTLSNNEALVDVSTLSNGLYIVNIFDGKNTAAKKLVVSK